MTMESDFIEDWECADEIKPVIENMEKMTDKRVGIFFMAGNFYNRC